jgi:hypothetical protein
LTRQRPRGRHAGSTLVGTRPDSWSLSTPRAALTQLVFPMWAIVATVVRPAAYGGAAAKAMRLLAQATLELARLRRTHRRPRLNP